MIKTNFKFLVSLLLFIFLNQISLPLIAQRQGGGFSGAYLFRENGTRPISLAGAYTAISNDPYTIFYNPVHQFQWFTPRSL